jgi:lipopolysaccharide transport system permease protein
MTGTTHYLHRIWEYRHFWYALVQADLRRRYRRAALGLVWSLLQPIALTAVLCAVYVQVLHLDPCRFMPFLLSGLAFWSFLSSAVLQGCTCFHQAEPYLRQELVPAVIFPLRTVLVLGFHLLIALALAAGFAWLTQVPPNLFAFLSLAPTLLLVFLFGWSLAILAGFAYVYFPDTHHLGEVGLQILFYATPIIYPLDALPVSWLTRLLTYNPLTCFLDLLRAPILTGQPPAAGSFALASVLVLLTIGLAVRTIVRHEHRLVFEM